MRLSLILPIIFSFSALAQDSANDRVVIPARNSSHPRMVNIHTLNGGVTVKAYAGRDVVVESHESTRTGRDRERARGRESSRAPAEVDGLKRLDLPGNAGLEIDEEDNVINIRTRPTHNVDVVVSVPRDTSVKVHCTNGGDIVVEGVHGEIDVNNLNGRITLTGISGTVVAHSLNGGIKATIDRVDAAKPISFSTLNGEVDVTLPSDFRANMKMKTDNGDIYSDFDVKLDSARNKPVIEPSNDGRFHMKADRTVYGTVNGGGQEASFTTFNGRISIRKKK